MNNFNKNYAEKMENMRQKKQIKQEILTKEKEGNMTFAPAINKYSRKIAEAGGIANVKKEKAQNTIAGNTTFSDTQPVISATVAHGRVVMESLKDPGRASPIQPILQTQAQNNFKTSLQRLKQKDIAQTKKQQ